MIKIPNWCNNDLEIIPNLNKFKNKEDALKKIKEFQLYAISECGKELLSADRFIPYPNEFKEKDRINEEFLKKNPGKSYCDVPKDGYNSGGYKWCIDNWGTKWGFCDVILYTENKIDADNLCIHYGFNTAWSPISPVIRKISEMFPEFIINYEYDEMGSDFAGKEIYEEGELTHQENCTYNEKYPEEDE